MELIKKHYEKVLLGGALVGLTVAAALLPLMIASERQQLADKAQGILDRKIDALPSVDLSRASNLLQRIQAPMPLNLTETNRLFNPVPWQRVGDRWVKQP